MSIPSSGGTPGQSANPDALSSLNSFETGAFGVLYSMGQGKRRPPALFVFATMIVEGIQVGLLAFQSDVPWGVPSIQRTTEHLRSFAFDGDFRTFQYLYFAVLVLLTLSFANIFYVYVASQKGEFRFVWPVVTIRFLVSALVTVGYIPTLSILLIHLDCDVGALRAFPERQCWVWPNLMWHVLSIIMLVIFVPFSLAIDLVFFDSNPRSKHPRAASSGREHTATILLKTAFTLLATFMRGGSWTVFRSLLLTAGSACLWWLYVFRLPLYSDTSNKVFGGVFLACLSCFLMSVPVAAAGNGPHNWVAFVVAVAALPVAFAVGFSLVGLRLKRIRSRMAKKLLRVCPTCTDSEASPQAASQDPVDTAFEEAERYETFRPETDAGSMRLFAYPTEVDVATRHILRGDRPDVGLASKMWARAVTEFPTCAWLANAHATFLLAYTESSNVAMLELRRAATCRPAFDIRFAVYCRDRDARQQRRSKDLGEERLDIVRYVELQKHYKVARRYHKEALLLVRQFWSTFTHAVPDIRKLPAIMARLARAESRATSAYVKLMDRYPNSRLLVSAFMSYNEKVLRDYDAVMKLAERLQELKEDAGDVVNEPSERGGSTGSSRHLSVHVSHDELLAHARYRGLLVNRGSKSMRLLKYILLFLLLSIFVMKVMEFIQNEEFTRDLEQNIEWVSLAGGRRTSLLTTAVYMYAAREAAVEGLQGAWTTAVDTLNAKVTQLRDINTQLYEETFFESSSIRASWTNPVIEFVRKDIGQVQALSLFRSLTSFATSGFVFMSLDQATVGNFTIEVQAPFTTVLDNGNLDSSLLEGISGAVDIYNSRLGAAVDSALLIHGCLVGAEALVLVMLTACLLRPMLSRLKREREGALKLFLHIPRDVVDGIVDGLGHQDLEGLSDGEGGLDDEDVDYISANATTNISGRPDVHVAALLTVVIVLGAVSLGFFFVYCGHAAYTGTEADFAGRRELYGHAMRYLSQQLMRSFSNSSIVVADPSVIADELLRATDLFESTNEKLEWGDDVAGLPGTARRDEHYSFLMDSDTCVLASAEACAEHPMPDGVVGLMAVIRLYTSRCRHLREIALLPGTRRGDLEAAVAEIVSIDELFLNQGFARATDAMRKEHQRRAATAILTSSIPFGLSALVLLLAYPILLRPLLRRLREESQRTHAMLLMIPAACIDNVPAIRDFVVNGHLHEHPEDVVEDGVETPLTQSRELQRHHDDVLTSQAAQVPQVAEGVELPILSLPNRPHHAHHRAIDAGVLDDSASAMSSSYSSLSGEGEVPKKRLELTPEVLERHLVALTKGEDDQADTKANEVQTLPSLLIDTSLKSVVSSRVGSTCLDSSSDDEFSGNASPASARSSNALLGRLGIARRSTSVKSFIDPPPGRSDSELPALRRKAVTRTPTLDFSGKSLPAALGQSYPPRGPRSSLPPSPRIPSTASSATTVPFPATTTSPVTHLSAAPTSAPTSAGAPSLGHATTLPVTHPSTVPTSVPPSATTPAPAPSLGHPTSTPRTASTVTSTALPSLATLRGSRGVQRPAIRPSPRIRAKGGRSASSSDDPDSSSSDTP